MQALRAGAGPLLQLGWARERAALLRAAAPVAAVFVYIWLAPRTGFIIAGTVMLLPLLLMLRTRVVIAIPAAILTSLVTYTPSPTRLRVPLPRGIIEGML